MSIRTQLAKRRGRRTHRVRNGVARGANGRPRLSVFRSNRHMYAQIIDDSTGRTLAAASSVDATLAGPGGVGGNVDSAAKVGQLIAERAKGAGVTAVVFDRGGRMYHGRIKALADASREGGLQF